MSTTSITPDVDADQIKSKNFKCTILSGIPVLLSDVMQVRRFILSGNKQYGTIFSQSDFICAFREFLSSYNKLSELCFVDCVWDFTSRSVKSQEERCALNCMEKYLKMNQRISRRFQEFQIAANENALADAKKSGAIPR